MSVSASRTEQIVMTFAHHPPRTEGRVHMHEEVRRLYTQFALDLEELLPSSGEKQYWWNDLLHSFWAAQAAVALHGDDTDF